jgi:hypothetical protein
MSGPHLHSHLHGHRQHSSSSAGGYGLGGHFHHGSVEMETPHMNRSIPPPYTLQQPYGQSSTGYPTTHHPRYGSNSVLQPPHPPPVFSHNHSHSGTVMYGENYGGHVRYGTGYGQNGAGNGGYNDDRNRPYSAVSRIATPQLPSSVAVVSDPAYNPSRPGTSQSIPPHPTSASIPPPPLNTLSQVHPNHRSHSHSYSNGQGRPSATGAIRTRREVNGASRSDEPAPVSTSPPFKGMTRPAFFSPYFRPGNAPGPKQHTAFMPP